MQVHVGRFRNAMTAEICRAYLESHGIDGWVFCGDPFPGLGDIGLDGRVTILVSKSDAARAEELIARWEDSAGQESAGDPGWRCAQCGEIVEAQFDQCWQCGQSRS